MLAEKDIPEDVRRITEILRGVSVPTDYPEWGKAVIAALRKDEAAQRPDRCRGVK